MRKPGYYLKGKVWRFITGCLFISGVVMTGMYTGDRRMHKATDDPKVLYCGYTLIIFAIIVFYLSIKEVKNNGIYRS
jgi:hypothetical protein